MERWTGWSAGYDPRLWALTRRSVRVLAAGDSTAGCGTQEKVGFVPFLELGSVSNKGSQIFSLHSLPTLYSSLSTPRRFGKALRKVLVL